MGVVESTEAEPAWLSQVTRRRVIGTRLAVIGGVLVAVHLVWHVGNRLAGYAGPWVGAVDELTWAGAVIGFLCLMVAMQRLGRATGYCERVADEWG